MAQRCIDRSNCGRSAHCGSDLSPTAESSGVSAQIGLRVVRGGPEVGFLGFHHVFHEGSTLKRAPRMLLGISSELIEELKGTPWLSGRGFWASRGGGAGSAGIFPGSGSDHPGLRAEWLGREPREPRRVHPGVSPLHAPDPAADHMEQGAEITGLDSASSYGTTWSCTPRLGG